MDALVFPPGLREEVGATPTSNFHFVEKGLDRCSATPGNEIDNQDYHCDHEKYVNQSSAHMSDEPE